MKKCNTITSVNALKEALKAKNLIGCSVVLTEISMATSISDTEAEVNLESKYEQKSLITIHAYRYLESFEQPFEFTDTTFEENPNALAEFPSQSREKNPLLELAEKDVGVQVMPTRTITATQTGFSFKRNKICQYENIFLDEKSINDILVKSAEGVIKKTKSLQRALLQNEMMNLALNDYNTLKATEGHDLEYIEEGDVLRNPEAEEEARLNADYEKFLEFMAKIMAQPTAQPDEEPTSAPHELLYEEIPGEFQGEEIHVPQRKLKRFSKSHKEKEPEEIAAEEAEIEARLKSEYELFVEFETKVGSRLREAEPTLSIQNFEIDLKLDELMEAARQRERELEMENEEEEEEVNESIPNDLESSTDASRISSVLDLFDL